MYKRINFKADNIGPIYFEFNNKNGDLKEGQKMFGSIRYGDLSVYTGPLIYKFGKGNKIGEGEQDFSHSGNFFSPDEVGLDSNYKLYKYIGHFDYRKTDWIYGNGVLYFTDINLKPKAFLLADWIGLRPVRKYQGKFDYSTLLPGYTKEMELPFKKVVPHLSKYLNILNYLKEVKTTSLLMIGDSWFEFYKQGPEEEISGSFNMDSKNKDVINIGIGGSTYSDWIGYSKEVFKRIKFKDVMINLGINDIHGCAQLSKIFQDFICLVKLIRKVNAAAHIYVCEIGRAPAFPLHKNRVIKFNLKIEKYCETKTYLTFLPTCKEFYKDNEFVDNIKDYYGSDLLHLSQYGCDIWKKEIIKVFPDEK